MCFERRGCSTTAGRLIEASSVFELESSIGAAKFPSSAGVSAVSDPGTHVTTYTPAAGYLRLWSAHGAYTPTGDNQEQRNKQPLINHSGGDWLRQDAQLEDGLRARLSSLVADRAKLLSLAEAARAASFPDAAGRVADIALQEARA